MQARSQTTPIADGQHIRCQYSNHHHHHHRVVLTDRCAAPWPLKISFLHRDESGIALASSWTRLSQVRRGRPGGLVQLDDGFLPSWLFTIKSKALFAGTSGSKSATWPKRDRRRLRRISSTMSDYDHNFDYDDWWQSINVVYLGVSGLRFIGREMQVRHRTVGSVVSESTVITGGMLLIGVGSEVIMGSV